MFKQYNEQHEKEKETKTGLIQKIKEMDKDILIRIGAFVAVILLVTVFAFIKVHKKENPDLIRIVKDKTAETKTIDKDKKGGVELILNETYKLNKDNFEIYISKKHESEGLIFIKPSDFITNNNTLILSSSVVSLSITGNPDIISQLTWSLSKNSYINVSNNNINITLNKDNSHSKSELLLKINSDLISKEQLISNAPLLQVRYIESAD